MPTDRTATPEPWTEGASPTSVERGGSELGEAGLSAGGQSRTVPWGRLRVEEGHNPRRGYDSREIDYLAATIRDRGLLQPIVVRPVGDGSDRFVVVAGERRYRAIGRLMERGEVSGELPVPVLVRECGEREALVDALVENVQRADLDPLDEAEAFGVLRGGYGMSTAEIGRVLGLSRRTVQVRLQLLRLVEEVRSAVRSGEVSLDVARVLAGAPPEAQVEALRWFRGAPAGRRSAEAVRARLRARAIPFSCALFDPRVYTRGHGGSVFDGGTAGRYFTDRELFVRLQRDALVTLRGELEEEWEWVEVVEAERLPEGYEEAEGGPGAVVLLKAGLFEVEVVRWVRRVGRADGPAGGVRLLRAAGGVGAGGSGSSAGEVVRRGTSGGELREVGARWLVAEVEEAVVGCSETALRLAVTALLVPGGGLGLRLEVASSVEGVEVPAGVARSLGDVARVLGLGESAGDLVAYLRGEVGASASAVEVFRALGRFGRRELERVHGALVALGVGGRVEAGALLAEAASDVRLRGGGRGGALKGAEGGPGRGCSGGAVGAGGGGLRGGGSGEESGQGLVAPGSPGGPALSGGGAGEAQRGLI